MPVLNPETGFQTQTVIPYDLMAAAQRTHLLGVCLLMVNPLAMMAAGPTPIDFQQQVEPLLESYCFDCHGDGIDKGGLELDTYKLNPDELHDIDKWLAAWRKLDSELMPPPGKSQPTPDERRRIQEWIKWQVFELDPEHPDPGRVTLRRLNRVEYEQTIHDLLGVDYATSETFPPDDTGYGFDTIGDVLSLSPLLMEKYLDAAQAITADLLKKASPQIPTLTIGGGQFRDANDRQHNARDLALAEATTVVHARTVPHPGRYRVTVEFRMTGSKDATTETASLQLLANGHELDRKALGWDNRRRIELVAEADFERGTNTFTLRLVPGNPPLPDENHLALSVNHVRLHGPLDGSHLTYSREYHRLFPDGAAPHDPEARGAYARKILRPLADRAFRRPVDEATLDRLVSIALTADGDSDAAFREGVGYALTAMLSSPRFLFRAEFQPEPNNPARIVPVDEFALASRLSYFLWSSLPDDELFALARTNRLRAQLPAQVDRMLADSRADRFVQNFVGQWLQARDVEAIAFDARRVLGVRTSDEANKRFNNRIRRAMRQETELFFGDLLRNDGTVTDLLTARHTFLNESLAKFYEVPGVTGSKMRKVTLPEESHRGGLLTHASILLVTSNPTRTSPVKRGQFILNNLLGTPAPPPPPDVPELEEAKREVEQAASLRELLAIHREKPLCASCHERMDPPGLAFEHFNALGMYREDEDGLPIVTEGVLVTGESFQTPADLAAVLTTSRRRDLYRCLTEKLLTYAIGRGMEYYDVPTIDNIVTELEHDQGRLSTLVHAVVNSPPFQMRRGFEPQKASAAGQSQKP